MAEYCEEECLYPALVPAYPIISCDGVTAFSWNTKVASSDNKPASTEYQRKPTIIVPANTSSILFGKVEMHLLLSSLNFATLRHSMCYKYTHCLPPPLKYIWVGYTMHFLKLHVLQAW